ncbi:phage head-tail joining protein [Azospirillum canadense]|uniref:phage head-tail joining protein n=1 Tax=Azospirillum canadense TaxID=403962 RepID=UPI002227AB93|nr:gpW family protein [Azospirillum canadense]MCW2242795.1 hypothetical protein [Azospirillum canadense]
MADLATLQARLAEAETALHRLNIGETEVKVSYDGKTVEYAVSLDAPKLERYIATLRAEIDRLSGKPRRPLYMSF